MKSSDIKKLFPKTVNITQNILDKGSLYIGENALKYFLPEELHDDIFWGLSIGYVRGIKLKTERYNKEYDLYEPWYLNEINSLTQIKFKLR